MNARVSEIFQPVQSIPHCRSENGIYALTSARKHQDTYVHEKPFPSRNRYSFLVVALQQTALLVLLAMGEPLQAQADTCSASYARKRAKEPRDDCGLRGTDGGFSSDARAPSTAVAADRPSSATEAPIATAPFDHSACLGDRSAGATNCDDSLTAPEQWQSSAPPNERSSSALGNKTGEDQRSQTAGERERDLKKDDFNRSIFYKNKLEFSLESGWLPINIPFPFDFLLGSGYNFPGLYYTLVPVIVSLRWQVDSVRGPRILRGNWDWSFSGSFTAIPRGAETHYFAYTMGIRRNFVQPKWRIVPFVDGRLGLGDIDAKGPEGVQYAQGQNFTFTLQLGSGVRYDFGPRFAISAGINYMHISNLYLSQPKFLNYGINVYGPMFGIDVRLPRHRHGSEP
ncbi:MAG TPA: acyloxyacyl hydrolase [Candidatus Sulfotelmatobacter sp.]|nr:acyloxyacyl hydrolase [Candidatus Sulfotelmatobacter sp.]